MANIYSCGSDWTFFRFFADMAEAVALPDMKNMWDCTADELCCWVKTWSKSREESGSEYSTKLSDNEVVSSFLRDFDFDWFSDWYKDVYGQRPHWPVSVIPVLAGVKKADEYEKSLIQRLYCDSITASL